jgi:2',3'-cyclic-nucleotide 2'-phosphodiesterase (5'-nucleotidase family)
MRLTSSSISKSLNFSIVFALILSTISCGKVFQLADASEHRYEITELIPPDSSINALILPYKIQLDSLMDVVIGNSDKAITKGKPESTLGNWMTDIMFEQATKRSSKSVDFAIQNYGGIRVPSLAAGPITVREIYEIMPFDNELVIIEAKGLVINRLFERIAKSGGWPISDQVRLMIKDDKIESLYINGQTVDPTKDYRFALPDYIANGGDGSDYLINQNRENLGVRIRDLLIEHLENEPDKVQSAELTDRIIIKP